MKRYPCVIIPSALVHPLLEQRVVFPRSSPVCRWCFGPAVPGYEVCARMTCYQNWRAVQALDLDWRNLI